MAFRVLWFVFRDHIQKKEGARVLRAGTPHVGRTLGSLSRNSFGGLPRALLQQLQTEATSRQDGSRTAEEVRHIPSLTLKTSATRQILITDQSHQDL